MEHHGRHQGAIEPRDDAIDLMRLMKAVRARKSWILIPTLVAFAAGLVFVMVTSPRYTAVTKVLLENQESYFTRPEKATLDLATPYDAEAVQSVAESVATADLARKAIDKLGLIDKPEFNPARSRNPFSVLLSLLTDSPGATGAAEDRVVDNFLSHLTVFPIVKSRVLQIEFSSSDPELAARGANVVADLFLNQQQEAKKDQANAAGAWLSDKITQLRGKVAEADAKVEAFRADSGLLAGANNMTTPTQQLAEITTQIASARSAQSAAAAKAQLLREMLRSGRLDSVPDFVKDESLRHYAETRVTLKAQIAEESRTLLPGHPRMKELSGQLAGLDEEIRIAAAKAVRGFEDEARLAGVQVSNLEGLIAKQSKAVATSDVDGVRLRALELDAKTAREQLESYIEKYREAAARDADNATPADARVIATAQEPRTPTFPKKGPTLLLVTLAGFLLSLGVVVARALLRDEPFVRDQPTPATANRRPSEALAASGDSGAVKVADDPTAYLETVVDRLAESADPSGSLTILVTGEATWGALALALTAARRLSRQKRAVLVDLGVSQSWLGDVFDHAGQTGEVNVGLVDLLEGRASFDQALHRDLSARLDILPLGAGEIDDWELEPVLTALAQSYSFVVLHASDWRAPAVAAAMASVGAVIVCAHGNRLEAMKERLRQAFDDPTIVTVGVALDERARPLDRVA
jgi:uncharacterized protein involved in exopolysaccharide biosynthesis